MSYKVKLNIFDGPLDLLLFLIKKDKVDIYDIPIAMITEQYLEYLELMKMLDLDIAGEFLVMAATLMHIKSKMLLPQEEKEEDEAVEEDPREELVRRLLEYKKFKEAASELRGMYDEHKKVFFRENEFEGGKVVLDDGTEYFEASLFDLITAFRKVLSTVPKKTFHKVVKDSFTVSDKISEISSLLLEQPKVYFSKLFRNAQSKDEVIATFLAILEMMKMRAVIIAQKDLFSEIEVIRPSENADTMLQVDTAGEEDSSEENSPGE